MILLAITVIYHRYRRRKALSLAAEEAHDKLGLEKTQHPEQREENAKLQFVRGDRPIFDLEELLRAPAEVLGGGSFGSSYKALLSNGPPVVVKRLRPMRCVGFEEFHEHMKRLGSISHPNLLPPLAFYYRNEDKLLISEFTGNGNLADHLHGNGMISNSSNTQIKFLFITINLSVFIIYFLIHSIKMKSLIFEIKIGTYLLS